MQRVLAAAVGVSLALGAVPGAASARLAGPPADDVVGFDGGFREGQTHFNAGEYLPAARTWTRAVQLLQEKPENKSNRAAVYGYIAEAYRKAVLNGASEDIIREGLGVLDEYADRYSRHYPGEELPAQVAETREKFRSVIAVAEAAREPVTPAPAPDSTPERPADAGSRGDSAPGDKPWRGLTIGGGVALGGGLAMLGMFAGGLARVRATEQQFDDPANGCSLDDLSGTCAEIDRYGRSMDRVATAGIIMAPMLLAAGAAMLAIGLKRRSAQRTIAPVFGPRVAGLVWEQRF